MDGGRVEPEMVSGGGRCVVCGREVPLGHKACRDCITWLGRQKQARQKKARLFKIAFVLLLASIFLLADPFSLLSAKNAGYFSSKMVRLKYVLGGDVGYVEYTALGEVMQELSQRPELGLGSIENREKAYVLDEYQTTSIQGLVQAIRLKSADSDEQAKIAISLVQYIPYDTAKFNSISNARERTPYEVVYDQKGLCGEKSKLLALLLKELGYGVVLFHWEGLHQAVGVKCHKQFSYVESGYCFIETVKPTIPTEKPSHYWIYQGRDVPDHPMIIPVADGNTLTLQQEFNDVRVARDIEKKGPILQSEDYYAYLHIEEKYGVQFDKNPNVPS